jgi:hypothetical protein
VYFEKNSNILLKLHIMGKIPICFAKREIVQKAAPSSG